MLFSSTIPVLYATFLVTATSAFPTHLNPFSRRNNNQNGHGGQGNMAINGLNPICRNLQTRDHGCVRYVRGFDVTGVVTEVDLTFPQVQSECDCIMECLVRPDTCASYVYKFTNAAAVQNGHRTCTLYSQFNLPSGVTIQIDLNNGNNQNINAAEITQLGNNPQAGGKVPQAFKDVMLNSQYDDMAFSGPVWQLANGEVIC